jgi:hypothetical protein
MTDKDSLKKFEEMFDLDSNGENDQAEEYGNSTGSNETFEDLSKEVQAEIKEIPDKGSSIKVEDPHDIIMEVSSREGKIQEAVAEEVVEKVEEQQDFDDFDELVVDEDSINLNFASKEKEKEVEEKEKEVEEKEKEVEEKEKETEVEKKETVEYIFGGGDKSVEWYLNPPADMYDGFYREKRKFLTKCIVGGEIEYARWTKELEEAQVDVVTEVFDQRVIIRQMEEIQQYRDRTKYIGVRVNNQYYLFDRFIVLLRGALAKVQYLKPVLKQDGLILEHMGDIELYMQRLKALHNSILATEKNLAASYEMLSRKVTICMELPPAERYDKKDSQQIRPPFSYQQENKELRDYDDLPKNAVAGQKKQIVGKINWGQI